MKKPKVKVYVITEDGIDMTQAKSHIENNFQATRVSVLEGDGVNSLVFNVPLWQVDATWTYLQKKRGIKKVWLGN